MFSIGDFKGPLDLLWQLVSREELDILNLPLNQMSIQFRDSLSNDETPAALQTGADFIALAATLIWFKSLKLLPKPQQELAEETQITDDPSTILHYLIDYCQLKQAAKKLATIELQQSQIYPRGIEETPIVPTTTTNGIEHLSLNDLAILFQQILSKAKPRLNVPQEDVWKVSDKTQYLLHLFTSETTQEFNQVFHADLCREELIVTFLALLELMKTGKIMVCYKNEQFIIKSRLCPNK